MAENPPIRVMLVDDHDIVRGGLIGALSSFEDLEVVGEASDGEQAVQSIVTCQPDVVLMDLVMPRMNGVEAITRIRADHPEIKIIVLTTFHEEDMVQGALEAGAIGYLLKNVSGDDLIQAIRAAVAGRSTLAPEATDVLIKAATRPPTLGHDLTERELEILEYLATGRSNREIAQHLVISNSTVKNHVSNILSKLNASNRAEAVAIALQNKLVEV